MRELHAERKRQTVKGKKSKEGKRKMGREKEEEGKNK